MTEQNKPETNPVVDTTPNTVPIVPDDWAALGAKAGYDPKPAEALRLHIVGPRNQGKTTWESSIPDTLILDTEGGADAIIAPRATRIFTKNYNDIVMVHDKLVADAKAGKKRFVRICYDTIDEFIAIIKHKLEEEKGCEDITEYRSTGYGYNLILQRFWSFVRDLEGAGYTWGIVGHITTKQETDPSTHKEVTRIRDAVYPSISAKIGNQCDFKVTIFRKTEEIEKKAQKKLSSGQIIEVPAGTEIKKTYMLDCITGRNGENKARGVPNMEDRFEIPLINGWDVFKEKYEAAVQAAKEQCK